MSIAWHTFGLPCVACDCGPSVSSLGNVVCGSLFLVDAQVVECPWYNPCAFFLHVFVYCNELEFLCSRGKGLPHLAFELQPELKSGRSGFCWWIDSPGPQVPNFRQGAWLLLVGFLTLTWHLSLSLCNLCSLCFPEDLEALGGSLPIICISTPNLTSDQIPEWLALVFSCPVSPLFGCQASEQLSW